MPEFPPKMARFGGKNTLKTDGRIKSKNINQEKHIIICE
jgi:hypothetical protein